MARARRSVTHPQDANPKTRPERWIYIGRRMLTSGKLGCIYLRGKGEEQMVYADDRNMRGIIGGIYRVRVVVGSKGSRIIGRLEYIEPSGDERTSEWQALEKANVAQRDIEKKMEKDRKENKLGELTLRQLQDMYHEQPPNRAALLGLVYACISKKTREGTFF